ncbi:hypothetical protein CWS02_01540 [Enterobacter sp. EA-1]|nr:hypothetical protein CWS02_01540 [Enterobacter sp. EA-1]
MEELKEVTAFLEEIVSVSDKIGSGFGHSNVTAAALLLFFNQCNVLDKLSKVRKFLYHELEERMSPDEFDEYLEVETAVWRPPYGKTEEEILEMLNKENN